MTTTATASQATPFYGSKDRVVLAVLVTLVVEALAFNFVALAFKSICSAALWVMTGETTSAVPQRVAIGLTIVVSLAVLLWVVSYLTWPGSQEIQIDEEHYFTVITKGPGYDTWLLATTIAGLMTLYVLTLPFVPLIFALHLWLRS